MREENKIVFDDWAEKWQQGCLLGNGFMGQVMYGRPREEIVELSHGAFFSGSGNVDPYPEKGAEAFAKARQAALKGDHEEVYRQTGKMMGKRGNYGTNLPVGKLHVRLEESGEIRDYVRYLNLDQGIAGCEYTAGGSRHLREAFTSHEDGVFAYKLKQNGADMAFTVIPDGGRNPFRAWVEDGLLCFETRAVETVHSDGTEGARLCGAVKVCGLGSGGEAVRPEEISPEEQGPGIRISGVREAVIYLAMEAWTEDAAEERAPAGGTMPLKSGRAEESASAGEGTEPGNTPAGERTSASGEAEKRQRAVPGEGAEKSAWERVKGAVNLGAEDYPGLRERHRADISSLMGRQTLRLGAWRKETCENTNGKERNNVYTRELLEHVGKGGDNRRLTELMYQYGRYLLLSSSRQDSPLPAHLQGVWNDDVACRIGWTCDMHLDINTQMNYWISEPGNLRECHEPLFNWMERRLIPNGRLTARKCYGYSGWVGELVSNAWGYAAPYWNESLSPCPTGGIWQASDYMEYYRYGQDKDFLRERALPVIEEAVVFFLEYLFEDGKGHLAGGPSISPENAFLVNGKKYFASVGCTYEMLMIRELFLEYEEICRELEIKADGEEAQEESTAEQGKDGDGRAGAEGKCGSDRRKLLRRVKEALPKLLPYRILADGTLAEWSHDYESADRQHRHTSHLLGLFPYGQITPDGTPDLARAAAASIKAKLTPYDNWEDTGWARSLLALYSAGLWDGDQAYRHLLSMQTVLTGPNLLVMHPPTRGAGSFMEVYELDGNTGFSMAVAQMLIQSRDGCIRLLPALPEAWPDGRFEGVAARGGITVDLCWEQGRPVEVFAEAEADTDVVFIWKEERRECRLPAKTKKQIWT